MMSTTKSQGFFYQSNPASGKAIVEKDEAGNIVPGKMVQYVDLPAHGCFEQIDVKSDP